MNCERARELASEALDGVLATDDDAAYRRHMDDCPPCRSFHAELQESLLVLRELPTIEVDDRFDAQVWRRIRNEEHPATAWNRLRARAAGWVERLRVAGPAWQWSPVGVAAALLLFFAVSNPSGFLDDAGAPVAGRDTAPAPALTGAPTDVPGAAAFRSGTGAGLASASTASADRGAVPVGEPVGDIPTAIERFLQMQDQTSPGRDLNLSGDRESYRRSNYSYPLRRIPDPASVASPTAVPVTGGRPLGPAPAWPGADATDAPRAPVGGSAVIAF